MLRYLIVLALLPIPAHADLALIQISPCTIIQTFPGNQPAPFINVPGKWQSQNVPLGWLTPDGAYKMVPAISASIIPPGQQAVAPVYNTDANCNVTVTYSAVPAPVTCSGNPGSSFAVTNGVVTHC